MELTSQTPSVHWVDVRNVTSDVIRNTVVASSVEPSIVSASVKPGSETARNTGSAAALPDAPEPKQANDAPQPWVPLVLDHDIESSDAVRVFHAEMDTFLHVLQHEEHLQPRRIRRRHDGGA